MATIIVLLLVIPVTIWRGFILSIIWNWFMIPILGLPSIGIAAAIGLSLVVQVFTGIENNNNSSVEYESETEVVCVAAAKGFVVPLVILFVAWIVRLCM